MPESTSLSPARNQGSPATAPKSGSDRPSGVRPEIQALRALAVGIVVLYHLWAGTLTGGFVGVDVFFVISGFLITAHLLREAVSTGRISLPQFWARRARRLLPASLVVLVVSGIATAIWVPRAFWDQFFSEIAASGLYLQNWQLATSSIDYLAADNVQSPVQHYWSLSAEEQFYIVWPILMLLALWFASKRSARARTISIGVVLTVVVVASFAYSVWLTATNPAPAYFITPTRAWEFGAGGLLALVAGGVSKAPSAVRAIVSWLGLAAILVTAVFYNDATPFPGYQAALPVLGTLAVIWAGNPDRAWAPSRLASIRPVQWLGDVSYSVYLWHFPLIVIAPFVLDRDLTTPMKFVILAATLVLAWASKTWIEDPVRQGRWLATRPPRWTFAATAAAMVIVVGLGASVVGTVKHEAAVADQQTGVILQEAPQCIGAGFATIDDPAVCDNYDIAPRVIPDQTAFSNDRPEIYADECRSTDGQREAKECIFGEKGSDTVVALVGDSHSAQWFPTLKVLAEQEKFELHVIFKSGCPLTDPTISPAGPVGGGCGPWNSNAIEALGAMKGLDLVVTAASAGYPLKSDGERDDRRDAYVSTLTQLTDLQVPVLVFADTPQISENALNCLKTSPLDEVRECGSKAENALGRPDLLGQAAMTVPGVSIISVNDMLCTATWCPGVIGNVIVYRDTSSHLTTAFAETFAPVIKKQFDTVLSGESLPAVTIP